MMSLRDTIEKAKSAIMSSSTMSDMDKFHNVFDISKSDLKKTDPQLYYAILGVLDGHKIGGNNKQSDRDPNYYEKQYNYLHDSVVKALGEERYDAAKNEVLSSGNQGIIVMIITAIEKLREDAGDFDKIPEYTTNKKPTSTDANVALRCEDGCDHFYDNIVEAMLSYQPHVCKCTLNADNTNGLCQFHTKRRSIAHDETR